MKKEILQCAMSQRKPMLMNATKLKRINSNSSQTLKKIEREGLLPNFLYEAYFTLIWGIKVMHKKAPQRLLQTNVADEQRSKITIKKIIINQIQQYLKKIICLDQGEFIPSVQGWSRTGKSINVIHYINKLNKKTM